jgi:hypothetical protein
MLRYVLPFWRNEECEFMMRVERKERAKSDVYIANPD